MKWTNNPLSSPNTCFWNKQNKSPDDGSLFGYHHTNWDQPQGEWSRLLSGNIPSDATVYMGPSETTIPASRPALYRSPHVSKIFRDFSIFTREDSFPNRLGELETSSFYASSAAVDFFKGKGLDVATQELNTDSIWDSVIGDWISLRRFRKFQPKCPLPFRQATTGNYQPACKFE